MNFIGPIFTWCNNQLRMARKWVCLDRCLINSCFSAFLDSYFIKHLPHTFSDHAPLLLTVSSHNSHKKTFYFDNYWLEYIGCHSAIREAWDFIPHSNSMHAFFHLLTRARSKLLSWQASGLNSLETNINKLDLEILDVETNNGGYY